MMPLMRPAATFLALLLSLATAQPGFADGRADWPGYAWQKIDVSRCQPLKRSVVCPPYHQKWDWKRNQWVDVTIVMEPAASRLRLTQRLTNNDNYDDDDVCVTVLVIDVAGHNLLAHHQNWHSQHGAVMQDDFTYRSNALASAATILLGARQCRNGPHQDDAIYGAVLAAIPR